MTLKVSYVLVVMQRKITYCIWKQTPKHYMTMMKLPILPCAEKLELELVLSTTHGYTWFDYLTACSYHWHWQDTTVLSYLHQLSVLSCLDPVSYLQLFSNLKYYENNWKVGNWKLGRHKTKLSFLSPIQLTPPTRTRQDSLVLSVSAVWTRHN